MPHVAPEKSEQNCDINARAAASGALLPRTDTVESPIPPSQDGEWRRPLGPGNVSGGVAAVRTGAAAAMGCPGYDLLRVFSALRLESGTGRDGERRGRRGTGTARECKGHAIEDMGSGREIGDRRGRNGDGEWQSRRWTGRASDGHRGLDGASALRRRRRRERRTPRGAAGALVYSAGGDRVVWVTRRGYGIPHWRVLARSRPRF